MQKHDSNNITPVYCNTVQAVRCCWIVAGVRATARPWPARRAMYPRISFQLRHMWAGLAIHLVLLFYAQSATHTSQLMNICTIFLLFMLTKAGDVSTLLPPLERQETFPAVPDNYNNCSPFPCSYSHEPEHW